MEWATWPLLLAVAEATARGRCGRPAAWRALVAGRAPVENARVVARLAQQQATRSDMQALLTLTPRTRGALSVNLEGSECRCKGRLHLSAPLQFHARLARYRCRCCRRCLHAEIKLQA